MPAPDPMHRAAVCSPCGGYRYTLTRTWDAAGPTVLFIGLNPSTADATEDDPTIRRCIGFARDWGYGRLLVANLFAWRATDPRDLACACDPVGPGNDDWLRKCIAEADQAVVAWGNPGARYDRAATVTAMLPSPCCLGLTKLGAPRHPLYVQRRAALVPFSATAR